MKRWIVFMGVVVATGLGAMLISEPAPEYHHTTPVASAGAFAVIELFTSQGCSSCPAADRLLNAIIEEAKDNDSPVYGLSFHVSYWNYLGWKDPYSNSVYNVRQGAYVDKLGAGNAYTPQMVVNGRREFVGSSQVEAKRAIDAALSEKGSYTISASASAQGEELVIEYIVDQQPEASLVNIALVKEKVENHVPRGENRGRTLMHKNVVVDFQTLAASKSGTAKISLPQGSDNSDLAVVVYLQDEKTYRITGACRVGI